MSGGKMCNIIVIVIYIFVNREQKSNQTQIVIIK